MFRRRLGILFCFLLAGNGKVLGQRGVVLSKIGGKKHGGVIH